MQINRKHIHIILFVALLGMASCSVTKNTPTRYKTMTQRVQLTLTLDQHQFNMASTMRMWRNQLIVLSVQPMLGIEMVRIEATPDSDEPYTLTIFTNPYSDDNEGYMKVFLESGGADNPREIVLRQRGSDGKWFLWDQFILVGIRDPKSADPWA